MPIAKGKVTSFKENIEFIEKMDGNLAYSLASAQLFILSFFNKNFRKW